MSEAMRATEIAPLKLEAAWRRPEHEAANVRSLRVVSAAAKAPAHRDRDELRSLVAEVLREELRSELGRRMTVSIRRLVQDEVARFFARVAGR